MKIYNISRNTQPTNPSFAMHVAFIISFLIALATVSHADAGYSCDIQEDSTCIVYMYDVLDENKYDIDDALEMCEKSYDGQYDYETDACVIGAPFVEVQGIQTI